MRMDCQSLFDVIGEKKTLRLSLDFGKEELYGRFPFVTPVELEGEIENRAGVVKLVFHVKFCLALCCDRCLKELRRDFAYSFDHTLVRSRNTDNDEYVVCEDGFLDLWELTRTDLLLELPVKILCSPDCKGLCPHCGTDLNVGSCECEKKEIDPRLAPLSQLLS